MSHLPFVKVCGLRESANAHAIASLPVSAVGFIFAKESPRYVPPEAVRQIVDTLPRSTLRVGVFRDPSLSEVVRMVKDAGVNVVQLHGNEDTTFVNWVREALPDVVIWKVISIETREDLERSYTFEEYADAFLFDTKCSSGGGSGRKFDWKLLDEYEGSLPYILGGGVTVKDAELISRLLASDPCMLGCDINSQFEVSPGVKDVTLVKEFLESLTVRNGS